MNNHAWNLGLICNHIQNLELKYFPGWRKHDSASLSMDLERRLHPSDALKRVLARHTVKSSMSRAADDCDPRVERIMELTAGLSFEGPLDESGKAMFFAGSCHGEELLDSKVHAAAKA
jgi:hypothetical protein